MRRDSLQNIGFDPQLRVVDIFGDFLDADYQYNLRCPLSVDGRDVCLNFYSKEECVQSCM